MRNWAKQVLWGFMLLAATGVAGYALGLLIAPQAAPPFVREALQQGEVSFYFHFLGGAVALVLGALQFSTYLRRRWVSLHRWLGRVYLLAVLASGGAGVVMASSTIGGWVADLGFGLLAVLWLATGAMAYVAIRGRRVAAHRRWMIRNYSLTLAAVTLRIYLPLSFALELDFASAYLVIAWACWVPNLVLAELLFNRRREQGDSGVHAETVSPRGPQGSPG